MTNKNLTERDDLRRTLTRMNFLSDLDANHTGTRWTMDQAADYLIAEGYRHKSAGLEEGKIGYCMLNGVRSKAYVTFDAEGMTAQGTNKHSDEPVTVRWNDLLQEWVETPPSGGES